MLASCREIGIEIGLLIGLNYLARTPWYFLRIQTSGRHFVFSSVECNEAFFFLVLFFLSDRAYCSSLSSEQQLWKLRRYLLNLQTTVLQVVFRSSICESSSFYHSYCFLMTSRLSLIVAKEALPLSNVLTIMLSFSRGIVRVLENQPGVQACFP